MYRLCVPLMDNGRAADDLEKLASELETAGIDTIFLVFDRVLDNHEMLKTKIDSFSVTREKLMSHGFEVNAWLAPTIGYGGRGVCDNGAPEKYTRIVTDKGRVLDGGYCPLDEAFVDDFLNTVSALAKTGVREIMLEDDYTLTGGKMFREHGCCCEKHMKLLSERLGENVSREKLSKMLYAKDGMRYRKAFLDLMGDTLAQLTERLEETIHSVDKDIRIGLSANASSYRIEGATMGELSKLTAGDTKPFIRMTGAPYWDAVPTYAANIEAIRVQTHWLAESGAELICEGDVYPRPRHWVPAAYLEGYDMILRADGKCGGILKYMTDYTSKADYENGYIERHRRNKAHYEEIERRFSGGTTVGLNIYESLDVFENAVFGDDITRENYHNYGSYQPLVSQWFALDNSMPITYDGQRDSASIVFGENARSVSRELLKNGAIVDAHAAKILTERGIDVGMRSCERSYPMPVEYFRAEDDYTIATANPDAVYYDIETDEKAEILSDFLKIKGGFGNYSEHLWGSVERTPACYFYENGCGEKFLVYAFSAEVSWAKGVWNKGLFRNYYRQSQLCRGIEKLQGRRLPAVCLKNPELYILCKRRNGSMSVGLWNFFADSVIEPRVILDREYSRVDFYNASGRIEGDSVLFDGDIPPYSFAFFTVYD